MVRSRTGTRGMWSAAVLALLGIALSAVPAYADDGDDLGAPPVEQVPLDQAPLDQAPLDQAPLDFRDDVPVNYEYAMAPMQAPRAAPTFRRGGSAYVDLGATLTLWEYPDGIVGLRNLGIFPFRWSENDPGAEFGGYGGFGYNINSRDRVEVRGGWLGDWDDTTVQNGRQMATSPTPGAPHVISPVLNGFLRTQTEIWAAEANWWRTVKCQPCSVIDVGLGVRYMAIEDRATVQGIGGGPIGWLRGFADNRFVALQLMGAYRVRPTPKIEVGLTAKALVGYMMRDLTESDAFFVAPGITPDVTREENDFSWGLEAELEFIYRFTPNFGVAARYTVLYLDAISRAYQMFDYGQTATGSVQLNDRTDTTLMNMFYVGFRFDF